MQDFDRRAPLPPSDQEAISPTEPQITTFTSLRNRNYRLPLLGALVVGAIAEKIGVPMVIAGCGIIVALFVLALGIFYPRLRRLE